MKENKKFTELLAAVVFLILGYLQLNRPHGYFDAIPHFMIALGLVYTLFDSSQVYGMNVINDAAKNMVLESSEKVTSRKGIFKTTILTIFLVAMLLSLGFGLGSAAHHLFK